MLRKMKQIFELITVIIGTIIGAGFISGAELLNFFPIEGYIYYLLFAGLFLFGGFYLLYFSGKRFGGFRGILQKVFKKYATLVHICILIASCILCGSMLAGFSSSLQLFFGIHRFLPLYALLLLVICFVSAFKGVQAVLKINAVLVPFMVILVLSFFKLPNVATNVQLPTWKIVQNILLFVAFNLFLAAPVLCDLGEKHLQEALKNSCSANMSTETNANMHTFAKELQYTEKEKRQKTIVWASLLATLLIVLTAATILENIVRCKGATEQTLPFLYTIQGKWAKILFAISAIGGIITTLFAAYYSLHSSVQDVKFALWYRLIFAAICYVLSLIGLKYIIQFCYPIIGVMGLVFLAVLLIANCRKQKKESTTNQAVKNL